MAEIFVLGCALGENFEKKYAFFDLFVLRLIGMDLTVDLAFHVMKFEENGSVFELGAVFESFLAPFECHTHVLLAKVIFGKDKGQESQFIDFYLQS